MLIEVSTTISKKNVTNSAAHTVYVVQVDGSSISLLLIRNKVSTTFLNA